MAKAFPVVAASLGLLLSGCAWLPAAGPTTNQVIEGANANGVQNYVIVDVTPQTIHVLDQQPTPSFSSTFGDPSPSVQKISVGDSLIISVWEAGSGSLFAAPIPLTFTTTTEPGSRPAEIPEQTVLEDGTIYVPFAGRLSVAGKTAEQVQDQIRQVLVGKATNPQILLTVAKSPANTATVTGEVVAGARVPLSPRGDRLLEVLATVGGLKTPMEETSISLTRNGVTATIPVARLVQDPNENIYVWPGDTITVIHESQYIAAFGATGRNAEIPINGRNVNLSQALGRMSGLLDDRADSSGVFLLRYEPKDLVAKLGTPTSSADGALVPVVYRFDLKNLQTYFLTQQFAVDNKDIVYVANSNSNTIQKFFQLIGSVTSPVVTGAVVNNSLQ